MSLRLLEQDYDDYEIVVCDNAGSPATGEVIDEARSPRIRYHRVEEYRTARVRRGDPEVGFPPRLAIAR